MGYIVSQVITVNCSACGGQPQFDDSEAGKEALCPLCHEMLLVTAAKPVGELSGGNQQKIALGRLLHHDARILLLDEPTRGIDVGSKAQIYRLMNELAGQGKALLFVSSYLPELLGVCDRIGVMCRGELSEVRPVADWSEQEIIRTAVGQAEPKEVAA